MLPLVARVFQLEEGGAHQKLPNTYLNSSTYFLKYIDTSQKLTTKKIHTGLIGGRSDLRDILFGRIGLQL